MSKRTFVCSAVAVLLLVPVGVRVWSLRTTETAGASQTGVGDCGPRALGIAAMRMGLPVELERLIQQCQPGAEGVSFATLKRVAAEECGLEATLRRVTWDQLVREKAPCVVHLANNHFVAVDPREQNPDKGESVQVLDVDGTTFWWDEAEMTKRWSDGAALLLGAPANAPRPLHVDNCWKNFGIVVNEPTVTCSFEIQNRGTQELKLAIVDKSCGCTTATPQEQVVLAGESGTIECEVRVENKKGLVSEKVVVEATGETSQRIPLYFSGEVFNGPPVIPLYSNLGPVMRGKERTLDVIVRGTRFGDPLVVQDLHVSAIRQENAEETRRDAVVDLTWDVEYLRDVPREQLSRWPHAGPFDAVVHVGLTVAKDSPAATFDRQLEFVTNLPQGTDPTVVRLSGQAVPAVEYSPKALIVRADENNRAELQLRVLDAESLSVASFSLENLPGLAVTEADSSRPSERRYTVQVEEGSTIDQGRAGFLSIELSEGERIQVPVACLISLN